MSTRVVEAPDAAWRRAEELRRTWEAPGPEGRSPRDVVLERLRNASGSGDRPLDLAGIRLAGEDLAGLDLSRCDLSGADLTGANLRCANLFGAKLVGALLGGADLSDTELTAADLGRADLQRTKLARAGLGNANLGHAALFGADLEFATLTGADLSHADLRCADLTSARLCESRLAHADLTQAVLRDADFERAELLGAKFDQADLRGARLRSVRHYDRASFIAADLRDIDFTGAYFLRRFAMDQNYLHEFRGRGGWHAWIYRLWWLTSDCGRSLVRWAMLTAVLSLAFAGILCLVEVDFGHYPTALSPLYFSIVTLTSLGYGDAVPMSAPAQIVCMVEVVTGYVMLGGLLSILMNKMARRAE